MPYTDKKTYKNAKALKKYLEKISPLFEGKTIDAIYIDDNNDYEPDEYEFDEKIGKRLFWDKNANEDVDFVLHTSVTLKFENSFINIRYTCRHSNYNEIEEVDISISETIKNGLLDISHYYSKNVIGQKIEKLFSEGYFDIKLKLNNKYEFNLNMWADDGVHLYEWIPQKTNEIDYDKLAIYRYEKYSKLKEYLDKIKNLFIGEKIEYIKRLGIIFNYDRLCNKYIELDEPIDIKAGKNHLFIDFAEESDTFCGTDLFSFSQTSYFDRLSWRSLNPVYKDNIIGQEIKDIILTKRDISGFEDKEFAKQFEDDFEAIYILLNNGYVLEITNLEDYMTLDELKESDLKDKQ